MATVLDPLYQVFQENTIIWILISIGVGGIITAVTNYIFQEYLPEWRRNRATRVAVQKYSFPIIQAAEKLLTIVTVLTNNLESHFKNEEIMNLLYHVGVLLGWIRILQNEVDVEAIKSPNIQRKYTYGINLQFNLNEFLLNISHLVIDRDFGEHGYISKYTDSLGMPALVLGAIGDLMISQNDNNNSVKLISTAEFAQKYKGTSDLKVWFSCFDTVFLNTSKSRLNYDWNKLIIFQISLIIFILNYYKKDPLIISQWTPRWLKLFLSKLFWLPFKFAKYIRLMNMIFFLYMHDRSHLPILWNLLFPKSKKKNIKDVDTIKTNLVEYLDSDNLRYLMYYVEREYPEPLTYYVEHGKKNLELVSYAQTAVYLDINYILKSVYEYLRRELNLYGYDEKFDEPYYKKLTILDKILLRDPRNSEALNNKGKVLISLGKSDEAFVCFENANKTDPTYIDPLINLGLLKLREPYGFENLEASVKYFEEALKLTAGDYKTSNTYGQVKANLWNFIGVAKARMGSYAAAYDSFQNAINEEPYFKLVKQNMEMTLQLFDPNMQTAYEWSTKLKEDTDIASELMALPDKLIEIVQGVQICLGNEFAYDLNEEQKRLGRQLTQEERVSFRPLLLHQYSEERKNGFLNCILTTNRNLIKDLEPNHVLGISLSLWSGCLCAAKTLVDATNGGPSIAIRGPTFEMIDKLCSDRPTFGRGVEIAPLWKIEIGQGEDVTFDDVALNSPVRKYEKLRRQRMDAKGDQSI